jgi:ferrochelatase
VGLQEYELAYQSGQKGWLGPTVSETLRTLADGGSREIVIVPLSFTCDNIETLYDIDIALKAQADELGVNLRRTESLNDSPEFIAALADIVLSAGVGQGE